eukprot:CAMPEP_0196763022 /NCGR_PEP_ID=MMETSP1095-20130614/3243_1 /TAXON_ID=96789 ORGANISM="Chromulina nebulosa, Strain UTEXLB2642" /NCGR_SAMPLE_ID=MMETSP1095 /ASSEMBLY_ACC=CAM_ASM_000446 /LENGTH=131 /DNA_ID=CAMNT_0042115311 /DNA_START=305 /DNA_END=697 /DNA_ORIENTATION=+
MSISYTDLSPRPQVIEAIDQLVKKVIADDDIIQSTNLNANKIIELAYAATGTSSEDNEEWYENKDLLDVGVICFPDLETSYFKVYNLKIIAYRTIKKTIFENDYRSGIRITVDVRKFVPNVEVIEGMKKKS